MSAENHSLQVPGSVPQALADAWNGRDPDGLTAIFEADAAFVNVTGLWWHDPEAIRAAHACGLARILDCSTLRVAAVRVRALTPEIGMVHARMRLTGEGPRRTSPPPAGGPPSFPSSSGAALSGGVARRRTLPMSCRAGNPYR